MHAETLTITSCEVGLAPSARSEDRREMRFGGNGQYEADAMRSENTWPRSDIRKTCFWRNVVDALEEQTIPSDVDRDLHIMNIWRFVCRRWFSGCRFESSLISIFWPDFYIILAKT
ncbi:hypothetical protein ROHU_006487 [Labeo rohita]|uniref:Uncharacterized protein n=1 Tax=Labeo rohita TaxID=84645 RepID=A0A498MRM5_LABRO|nr:hypothetical protein ROHU_006487 [Labeo rohita]